MDPNFQKFIKPLQQARLTPEEKADLRGALLRAVQQAPVRPEAFSWRSRIAQVYLRVGFAAVLFIATAGGIVTATAQQALPGELLYSVKTRINEPVAGLFTSVSPVAKAQFETHLVEVRLAEVERLVSKKSLSSEQKSRLGDSVARQTTKAAQAIERLEEVSAAVPAAVVNTAPVAAPETARSGKRNGNDNQPVETMSAPAAFTPAATVVSTSSPASAGLSGKREQKNERRRGRIEVEVDAPAIKAELDEVLKKHDKVIKELREDSEGRRGKKDRDD